ncbi:head-tail connector protein [Myroides odoratimimus]|uniref:head-tail connector protein n=1 Tax=Myroides odoratimimus TaxID=76832 RepID=UPI0029C06955|nr:head-tail connector protein [Myroides odoratimimus]MDX4973707.1 head-tail connector protein [Myroides odoratimimus]
MVKAEAKEEEGVVLLDLKLAKKHLRVEEDYVEDDELIELQIASALAVAENYTSRKLVKGQLEIVTDSTSDVTIEKKSMNDVLQGVEVIEEGVDSIALPTSAYYVNVGNSELYTVKFRDVVLNERQQLKIVVDYGYTAKTLPKPIKQAMLLNVGEAYEKREDRAQGNNSAVNNLLRPYRKW